MRGSDHSEPFFVPGTEPRTETMRDFVAPSAPLSMNSIRFNRGQNQGATPKNEVASRFCARNRNG
jgi:hypothetical protein